MDRDGVGKVASVDAAKMVKRYRKSLPHNIVQGLENAVKAKV